MKNKLFPRRNAAFNTEAFDFTGFLLDSFFILVVLLIAIVHYSKSTSDQQLESLNLVLLKD